MNTKLKEHLLSAVITFITGFASVLILSIDTITIDSLKNGSIAGLGFVCFRAGVKELLNWIITS